MLALEPDGVDAAFECAGNNALLEASITSLAWGGRVVIVGLAPTGSSFDFQPRSLFNDKAVMGCRMGREIVALWGPLQIFFEILFCFMQLRSCQNPCHTAVIS